MEIRKEDYTPEFEDVLEHCKKHNLFLGEGNPNAQILLIGKEVGGNKPNSLEEIKQLSDRDVERNLKDWQDGYNLEKIKADIFKNSKNPTWNNYQKLVSKILNSNLDKYDFLNHCFMTELSQIHLPNSNYLKEKGWEKEGNNIRQKNITERESLFSMTFFRSFPIIIMACGHYPRDFGFDIQYVFDVECKEKVLVRTERVKNRWYNIHIQNNGNSRILIHTRQFSTQRESSETLYPLINTIAEKCRSFITKNLTVIQI
ncbi:hypothetical protein FACS189413_03310 [Bacteroidia bacterium]|nr:hypothetical protein FACS189413_03310 [Bacteroidia bacterium]